MANTPQHPDDRQFDELRRLLAMKRHEQPPRRRMDGFVSEFHRRLAADRAAEISRRAAHPWLRLREWLGMPPAVPGDESFDALRRLLALKRYEQPTRAYLAGFVTQFHRRLRESENPAPGFIARLRVTFGDRPFAAAQFAGACLLAVALTVATGLYRQRDAGQPAYRIVASAAMDDAREAALPVHYVLDSADGNSEEVLDASVLKLPTFTPKPAVHFVMDSVDLTPRVYETAFNF
jgi:hypothetical protein